MFSLWASRNTTTLPRSLFSKTLRRVGYATLFVTGGSLVTYKYYDQTSQMSLVLAGRTKAFQKQLEQEYNIPLGDILPKLCYVMCTEFVGLTKEHKIKKAKELVLDFPDIHLGYTLLASIHRKDDEEREKYLAQAYKVAADNAEKNAKILWLLPDRQFHFQDIHQYKPEKKTLQENKLWSYSAVAALPMDAFTVNQCAIVKGQDGKLILINPTQFDEAAVNWINSLGSVGSLVTPTAAHGFCLAKATAIWPEAKVYGTSPDSDRDHPELKWNWLTDDKQVFGDELVHMQLKGNVFGETVFYHPSSKSLLGLTDLLVNSSEKSDWNLRCYLFSMGVFRPQTSKMNFYGVQGYMYPAVTDWGALSASIHKLLKMDIEHLVLGHGGDQYHGSSQVRRRIQDSYDWILEPSSFPSWFERRVYLPLQWMRNTGLGPDLLRQKMASKQK